MKNRGAITLTSVVTWGIAIVMPLIVSSIALNSSTNKDQDKQIYDLNGRVSRVESTTERIPEIEKKLDALLINQGINPNKLK